jgi:RNA-directed DNA polymerase
MTKTSIGLQELRKRIAEKAKAEPRHRFWGLYTHVWKLDVLEEAYRLARQNSGAPGSDGVTFEQIEAQSPEKLLQALSQELREKTYQPLPCRLVAIPKEKGTRQLKVPAIRDRVVQGALRLILEPIFESDFQEGSFGYRPGRGGHQALNRVRESLHRNLHQVIDLDLASFYDSVRHDLMLMKLAERIQDGDVLWLCKSILKGAGKRGLPQGSVIGPLWANVFLNDVDRMLERAQEVTRDGKYQRIQYTRWADDLVVLVSNYPTARHWADKVEQRLREEFTKLDLTINEDKTRRVDFAGGEPFDFLGYTFRWVEHPKKPGKKFALARPQGKKRTRFLRALQQVLRRNLYKPVGRVIKEEINPRVRGWVNYFRWGNAGSDLAFVSWQVDRKVRRFASRQRPKHSGVRWWTQWSHNTIYREWGLYSDYRVLWRQLGAQANAP